MNMDRDPLEHDPLSVWPRSSRFDREARLGRKIKGQEPARAPNTKDPEAMNMDHDPRSRFDRKGKGKERAEAPNTKDPEEEIIRFSPEEEAVCTTLLTKYKNFNLQTRTHKCHIGPPSTIQCLKSHREHSVQVCFIQ